MRVIVCTLNGRIAPKFYDAAQLFSLMVDNKTIVQRKAIAVDMLNADELCALILHMKGDVIICGGIRIDYQEKLNGSFDQLIYNVIGNIDDVVKRFLEGNLCTGDIVD